MTTHPSRRRWPWVVLIVLALLVAVGAWMALGLRSSATEVQAHAAAAEASLGDARNAMSAGDYAGAAKAAAAAQAEVEQARIAAGSRPVRIAAHVPYLGQAVDDLDRLIAAAGLVATATGSVVDVYGGVAGKLPGSKPLFSDGVVDLAALAKVSSSVDAVDHDLTEATDLLNQVRATVPGTGRLGAARDAALAGIAGVAGPLATAKQVLPLVPSALGSDKPQRYLIAILNQSEMRAGGGAPLSVAVVTFDKGRFSVGDRGSVAQLRWPGDGVLEWKGAAGSPWNDPEGLRRGRFASSNFHPDFRSAGFDIAGAWRAGDRRSVAGVIGIDLTAIADVLRATGPIPDTPFGTLTADNLGQVLLVDAYRDFAANQADRQRATEALVDVMMQRLLSGSSLVPTIRALGSAAPQRHFQVWAGDKALAAELDALGLGGAVRVPQGADVVAVSSQNLNASKVDVFAQRAIDVRAIVAADGSATVTQTVRLTNAIPEGLPVSGQKEGYTTAWSRSEYFFYRPTGATDAEMVLPDGFHLHPWNVGKDWVDDGHGHEVTRIWGWLEPRASADVSLSYRIPAGTFLSSDGNLAYRLVANPQPTWQTATLSVTVSGPTGTVHTERTALDRVVDLTVPVR